MSDTNTGLRAIRMRDLDRSEWPIDIAHVPSLPEANAGGGPLMSQGRRRDPSHQLHECPGPMTGTVTWLGYGRSAAEELRSAIRSAKGDEPLAPVSVVVPSNYVGVATRRLLASGTFGKVCGTGIGVAAVSFLTVYRMAELLGSSRLAGETKRPVSTPVIAAALRASLAERPGIFAPVAGHEATESALIAAYRELDPSLPAPSAPELFMAMAHWRAAH